ncbi:5-deoxy-glucuronate isomerase [Aurantimonas sp. Leaf443]|uniref:5-deoxy-glucuronate isomerase n=1 Tax=Aurantimonas sp. Leaf443 TaxID=1736378 RepID=UPI0006FBFB49|nr:5-deoxy-glucuronate isomerase [Aurantimonas sp. Leaf443]KQT84098.1 5-deoxy-glucuronate isomerase [Aurantimonas sp. Leaf443]
MSRLHRKPAAARGLVHDVTPRSAGWGHVGFALRRLAAGERFEGDTGDRELCLVLVSGRARASVEGADFGAFGERMSPFEGPPHALYLPAGTAFAIEALTDLEAGFCTAPGAPGFAPKMIAPGTHPQTVRGKGTNTRYVTNIMPENDAAAHQLLVVEVVTPGGHTSSYPPHKHDRDALPDETYLEETYYHRLNPPQGYAFQRVYTDADETGARALDEAFVVTDGDVVLVPEGYHPVATVHGYDSYYLNTMAGPRRAWKFHNEADHAWLFSGV